MNISFSITQPKKNGTFGNKRIRSHLKINSELLLTDRFCKYLDITFARCSKWFNGKFFSYIWSFKFDNQCKGRNIFSFVLNVGYQEQSWCDRQIHDRAPSCLGTCTSLKRGGIKLVLMTMYVNCFI